MTAPQTTLSPEQLALRKTGITATDVAAITGVHPYRKPIDIWLEKTGQAPPFIDNDRARWGRILETPILRDYCERWGCHYTSPGTLRHPKNRRHIATPDALFWLEAPPASYRTAEADRGGEVKTHTTWIKGYGEPGSDDVPPHEAVQSLWGAHVCGLERWDLIVFQDGLPTDYHLTRDPELEGLLIRAADKFWRDHIEGNRPPAVDGSASYSAYIDRLHPEHREGYLDIDADEQDVIVAIIALNKARRAKKQAESAETVHVQQVKQIIGDHEGIVFPALTEGKKTEKITWKKSKDSIRVDWLAVAREYRNFIALHEGLEIDLDEVVERNTETVPGSRRFNLPRSGAWATK